MPSAASHVVAATRRVAQGVEAGANGRVGGDGRRASRPHQVGVDGRPLPARGRGRAKGVGRAACTQHRAPRPAVGRKLGPPIAVDVDTAESDVRCLSAAETTRSSFELCTPFETVRAQRSLSLSWRC